VINVGGVKVFPSEIEDVLLSHPAVEEVVVFSVPEARFGEVPHGKVKLRTGAVCAERELLRFANERLSVFKTLREVEFVDEIPKTVTGKPRRIG
jgi:acyl-CoA synthetase (AMP-forming)/AMP-acid ligase II